MTDYIKQVVVDKAGNIIECMDKKHYIYGIAGAIIGVLIGILFSKSRIKE